MSRNTGLLTARCDPFGAETAIRLAGGLFPAEWNGKNHWYCDRPAVGTYRMICTGGQYGQRLAADGQMVAAYTCEGGHRGQPMSLCRMHVAEFSQGPPQPGFDRHYQPYGQVGGTKANELCPPCAAPPQAKMLTQRANELHMALSAYVQVGIMGGPAAKLQAELDDVAGQLTELAQRGIVHRCPLRLVEES